MTTEQTIQDVAMIARNGIDRVIELERENKRLAEALANANEDLKAALRELYPVIGDETDDDPYCQCGNDPYEEEAASGKCASCGKELP